MLNKVLKYDIKRLGKTLFPIYLVTIIMGVINYVFQFLGTKHFLFQIPGAFVMMTFIFLLLTTFIGTFVMSIRHFYTTMLSDEGYLTNTLPVTKNTLITSKLITTLIFTVIGLVVLFIAVWIGFLHFFNLMDVIKALFESNIIYKTAGITGNISLIILVVLLIIGYIVQWFFFVFAISLGHTRSEKRWMFSLVYGMLLYFFQQMGALLITGLVTVYALVMDQAFISGGAPSPVVMNLLLGLSLLLNIVVIAVYWVGTNIVFKTKLNLE